MGSSGSQPAQEPPPRPKAAEPEPEPKTEEPEPEPKAAEPEPEPKSYPVPYSTSIPEGLHPSKVITVSGDVLPNARRFHINLRRGADIAFHLGTRFNENTVVRNSRINGTWGPVEKDLPVNIPFIPGCSFKVEIICEANCYRVTGDGQHLLAYTHRLKDLTAVNALEVTGDIKLTDVQV
ncbi:PREDICTED: galectin-5-like isoform X2 [Chinchilla lanigera]|uniref:galectin-5-like isoform X2 n=1 Tax=Chinchilla lanigera TaxID=34839 RepID=UPI00038F0C4D|nr:PREDICTED: galectin-5-like isoform X2 [Chinchilla lanigera]